MAVITSPGKAAPPAFLLRYLPLFLAVVFALLFLPTFQLLATRWIKWDESMSHGIIIVMVFLFLTYKSLPWNIQQQPSWLFWLFTCLIGLLSSAWFIFNIININLLEQIVLLPLFWLMVAAIFGYPIAWKHKLLLFMPIFAFPVWNQFNNGLLDLSVFVVGGMVRQWNMTALIEGNSIFIPYGHILIADGCSGLRYFIIALAIGYIISYLNHYRTKALLITLVIAATIGLIANWIRIFILILIGYSTQMQSSLMQDHELFGWIIFGVLCLPAIYFAPVIHQQNPEKNFSPSKKYIPTVLITLCALAIGPVSSLAFNAAPIPATTNINLPTQFQPLPPSRMPVPVTSPEQGQQQNARIFIDDTEVYVQINLYQRYDRHDKLVPYLGYLYNPDEWFMIPTASSNTGPGKLTQFKVKNGFQQVAQLQWFKLGHRITGSERTAKFLQIPALFSQTNDFSIFTLQARCQIADCSTTKAALEKAARILYSMQNDIQTETPR